VQSAAGSEQGPRLWLQGRKDKKRKVCHDVQPARFRVNPNWEGVTEPIWVNDGKNLRKGCGIEPWHRGTNLSRKLKKRVRHRERESGSYSLARVGVTDIGSFGSTMPETPGGKQVKSTDSIGCFFVGGVSRKKAKLGPPALPVCEKTP